MCQGDFNGGEFLVLFFVICFVFCCLMDLRVGGGRWWWIDWAFFLFVCVMGMVGGGYICTLKEGVKYSKNLTLYIVGRS